MGRRTEGGASRGNRDVVRFVVLVSDVEEKVGLLLEDSGETNLEGGREGKWMLITLFIHQLKRRQVT